MTRYAPVYQKEIRRSADTCEKECTEEFSALSSYAYLMELVTRSQMNWQQLDQHFRQDFRGLTTAPVRRIDISIRVLERALVEDLGNPQRQEWCWVTYDNALHAALIGLLKEYMGKSERELAACFPLHASAFDVGPPFHKQNEDLEDLLRHLESEPGYTDELVRRL